LNIAKRSYGLSKI